MWLGKLTVLDMTPLCWLGRKTSTQTNKLWYTVLSAAAKRAQELNEQYQANRASLVDKFKKEMEKKDQVEMLEGNGYTFRGRIVVWFVFASRLKKESTLKGKNLLPRGADSFLLE